jgi:hypothetical protein
MAQAAYGPPPPPVPVPGGFLTVVTSQTCDSGGVTIGPVSGGNTMTTVAVPGADCDPPIQITITEPDIAAIGTAGFCGHKAVAGIGVIIQNLDGSVDNAFFVDPIVVTISSPSLKPGSIVVAWNGERFVRVGVAQHNGSVTIKLGHGGYNFFAILQPTRGHPLGHGPCRFGVGMGRGVGLGNGVSLGAFDRPGFINAFLTALFGRLFGQLPPGTGVMPTFTKGSLAIGARSSVRGLRHP